MNDSHPSQHSALSTQHSVLGTLSWAPFLASSWTWCIGMFLPVLLVRDSGQWGFWAFAIPNVLGAAAMGWVLRTREASQTMVRRHRTACLAFSIVTIAFHCFFAGWIIRLILGEWGAVLTLAAAGLFFIIGRWLSAGDRPMAVAACLLSALCAWLIWRHGRFLPAIQPPRVDSLKVTGLAMSCALGFALCPYLDLTFHRARQATDAAGARVAFSLGFGVLFFSMILLTLAYAPNALALLHPRVSPTSGPMKLALTLIGMHMVIQSGITICLHVRELMAQAPSPRNASLATLAAALLASGLGVFGQIGGGPILGLDRGELIYRLFMSSYGLVFPAYVWLFMGKGSGFGVQGSGASLLGYVGVLVIAAPLYFLAFVLGEMRWLLVAVPVVVLGRWVISSADSRERKRAGV